MKIESAGGVVFRKHKKEVEVLLIQDRFGYWTFPKGKKEPGETDEQTALREILEETQVSGKIIKRLPSTLYHYPNEAGQDMQKIVTYFLVEYLDGAENPQEEEISHTKWFSVEAAEKLLSEKGYPNNQPVFIAAKREISQLFFDK